MNEYNLINRFLQEGELQQTRRAALAAKSPTELINPGIDDFWASLSNGSSTKSPYMDYFFTGEDMKVYFAETDQDSEFKDLPLAGVAFTVEQEKAPVYGFWSRTYDAVMRGTRLIQGQFVLYSKDPDYMKRLLIETAKNRSKNARNEVLNDDYPAPSTWREDAENLDRYWSQTLDPAAASQGASIWSSHPPFSLVVVYGVQNSSVELTNFNDSFNEFDDDNALYFDTNQRLVESQLNASRFIIDGCEITSMQQQIAPGGFVMESYSFFARDIIVPSGSRVRKAGPRTSGRM